MTVERWRPFGASMHSGNVSDIRTEVNRLLDNFFGRPAPAVAERAWAPPRDLYETKDDLVLTPEVPGVRDKDVTVSITGALLSVKGERRVEHDVKGQQLLHVERVYGKFERLVQLRFPSRPTR